MTASDKNVPTPEDEPLIDGLMRLEAHARACRERLEKGLGSEAIASQQSAANGAQTYRAVARELVEAHRKCPYRLSQESSLADDTVRWRANLHRLFKEASRLAKSHGKANAYRMLEAIPPPHYPEIRDKSRELMAEVLEHGLRPRDAAQKLTRVVLQVHRGVPVTWDFVREGARLKARSGAEDDHHFAWSIDYMAHVIAPATGKAQRRKSKVCPISPEESDKTVSAKGREPRRVESRRHEKPLLSDSLSKNG